MHHKFMRHNYYLVDVIIFKINIVRTGFDLNPKQEWTQAQKARTINLQRVGEKASLNLRKRYWSIVLKGKSCICTNPESIIGHALVVRSRVQNSFLLLLYFFHLFLSPFSPFSSFLSIFVLYTTVFTPISPPTCESGVQSFFVPFRPPLNLLLLAVRLLVHCSGITSTLIRPES